MRLGYSELIYLDTIKTLCNYFNRLDPKLHKNMTRYINREVEYGSGKYHYTESVGDFISFSISDRSPLSMIKQIIERHNERLF